MKNKKLAIAFMILIAIMTISGCTNQQTITELEKEIDQLKEEIKVLESEINTKSNAINDLEASRDAELASKEAVQEENKRLRDELEKLLQLNGPQSSNILTLSLEILDAIKNEDFDSLIPYVHPSNGVRFSPYSYVDLQNDIVFTSGQMAGIMQNTQTFLWGHYDGSGEPIQLTFNDYYDKFIYDEDFLNPHMIGNNVVMGSGNTINNIDDVYPNGMFVEFHFTGFNPQFSGLDWRSLRLVFEELNGTWYLIGIIHDQWTI